MALEALAALFALALLVVALALPGWIAGRGAAMASEALGRSVSIRQARVEPWRLGVVIDELRIAGATADAAPLLTLAQCDMALSLRSLLRGRLVVESLTLTQPDLRLARVGEGRYDIDDLVQRFAAKPGASETPGVEFAVYNVDLTDGRVQFEDRPVQRRHELAALHLALPFLSTLAADVAVTVQPRLSGSQDGVTFDSRAEALPFKDDASARLSLKLTGLELAPLAAYLPESLPLRLAGGRLDVDLALDFAERAKQMPSLKLGAVSWPITTPALLDAGVRVDDARLRAKASLSAQALHATATLQGLAVERLAAWLLLPKGAQWAARLAAREAVLDDAYARLSFNEQGRFNLRDIGPADAASAAASASAPPSAQPEIAVAGVGVNRGLVDLSDRFVKPGYSARLSDLHGSLGAFSSTHPAMAPLTMRGKVARAVQLEIDGRLAASNQIILNQPTFGDRVSGEEAQIAFAAARTELQSTEQTEQLDCIARTLTDKPGVRLTVTGWANAETEAAPLREQRLDGALAVIKDAAPAVAPSARAFVAAPKLCNGACAEGWRPHVELSLDVH